MRENDIKSQLEYYLFCVILSSTHQLCFLSHLAPLYLKNLFFFFCSSFHAQFDELFVDRKLFIIILKCAQIPSKILRNLIYSISRKKSSFFNFEWKSLCVMRPTFFLPREFFLHLSDECLSL